VFAGDKEDVSGGGRLEQLVDGVELARFGKMADVAGVQHKFRLRRQRIDLVDYGLECPHHVGISRLVESHVTVADLDKEACLWQHVSQCPRGCPGCRS
jgi:hypothetical protein